LSANTVAPFGAGGVYRQFTFVLVKNYLR
jgi:hypothetical protein